MLHWIKNLEAKMYKSKEHLNNLIQEAFESSLRINSEDPTVSYSNVSNDSVNNELLGIIQNRYDYHLVTLFYCHLKLGKHTLTSILNFFLNMNIALHTEMESKNEQMNKLRKLSFAYVTYHEKINGMEKES